MIVISDTSILSGLVHIGQVGVLSKLFGEVIITEEIASECIHPLAPAGLRNLVSSPPAWLVIKNGSIPYLPETEELDKGEASAISLASSLEDRLLLIDEQAGRRIARQLNIPITGLIGVLGKAAQLGYLEFDSAIRAIRKTGFRVSDSVIRSVQKHLLQPIFLEQLPRSLVSYLKSKASEVIKMKEGQVRSATFVPFEELELEWFHVEEEEEVHDEEQDPPSAHFLGFSLLKSAENYHPWGVFLWLPQFQEFGSWDQDHLVMMSYPDISWEQILRDPTWFINVLWYPDRISHRKIRSTTSQLKR